MKTRLEEQQDFCQLNGWGEADLFPLAADASSRTYTRLIDGSRRALLMDAPPAAENLPAFIRIAEHLSALGVRTPSILAHNVEQGLALLEDFGDETFTRLLDSGHSEKELYLLAIEVLIQIQTSAEATRVKAPPYDEKLLLSEVERFTDWFVPAFRGHELTELERDCFVAAWQTALKPVSSDRSMLVVRDFHVDNLMIVGEEKTVSSCGVLDFQDALIGSPAYDLVSLVEDARRDVLPETYAAVMDRYFEARPDIDRAAFERDMALLGAQRHTKVLGLFVRLSRQDNKHGYLKHIPRVARLLAGCLEHPALKDVKHSTEKLVPNYIKAEIEPLQTSLVPGQ